MGLMCLLKKSFLTSRNSPSVFASAAAELHGDLTATPGYQLGVSQTLPHPDFFFSCLLFCLKEGQTGCF